jgi:hypothetical protein
MNVRRCACQRCRAGSAAQWLQEIDGRCPIPRQWLEPYGGALMSDE